MMVYWQLLPPQVLSSSWMEMLWHSHYASLWFNTAQPATIVVQLFPDIDSGCTSLLVPCVTMTVLPPLTNVNLPSNKWQNCTYGSQQSNQWTLIHTAVANTIQSTYWQKDCDGVGPIMHVASMLLSLHSNMAAGHQEWPFFHHLAMPGIWCSHTTAISQNPLPRLKVISTSKNED